MKSKELTICGLAAVKAQFAANAAAIKRLYFDYATGRKIGVICKALAQAKKIYRCVEPAELEKISGTVHHGGIVAIVTASELRAPTSDEVGAWSRSGEILLVLDRIGNAHNLGAIARTAAFFGVKRIVIPDDPTAARPSEAAHRVAEGALSHLQVLVVPKLPNFLRELASAGFVVLGAAAHGGRPKIDRERAKPVALVLGNEEHGLGSEVAAACTRLVTLPASGPMESLNVSAAAAVLLWILQRGTADSKIP